VHFILASPSIASLRPVHHGNYERIGRFYDRVSWLYPLVDLFCGAGRRRLVEQVNCEPPGRLLEIGVGPGRYLPLYRRHHVTAIDCSARMVALSRARAPAAEVRQMDGERLEFADASFDYVTLCHVLSVTGDPARMLAESHRVLRPGGRIFVLNHETPRHAWRHVEARLMPLARGLRFRSWFRLDEIPGVQRFRLRRLAPGGWFGLMAAYALEK
jgi:phosphatidylethanolamine/phosphatidyl-N-methylethanolamine N-methyltransferase